MPKDKTENIDRYKIRGGHINEFEFSLNEGAMTEQERERFDEQHGEGLHGASEPGAPQNVAQRIRHVEEVAREKVKHRREQQGGAAAAKTAGAKKSGKKSGAASKSTSGRAKKSAAKKR
jgi:hypothetical protein